jgi:hypothetical protein
MQFETSNKAYIFVLKASDAVAIWLSEGDVVVG